MKTLLGWSPILSLVALSANADIPSKIEGTDRLSSTSSKYEFTTASRATVVAFISANCPCSASHEAALEALHRKYEPLGFKFIGVHSNQDEPAAKAAEHFRASPIRFQILSDSDAKYADIFGALKTPHVFVVSPNGEILYQGGVDDSHTAAEAKNHPLADALAKIAGGEKPEISRTRTLGCVISRKP